QPFRGLALPALPNTFACAQTVQRLSHLVLADCCGHTLCSRQPAADAAHEFAVRLAIRHHHERHCVFLAFGSMVSCDHHFFREHPRAAAENDRACLVAGVGAIALARTAGATRAPLPCRGSHRPLVDTRYLCRRDCRHAGAIWGARDHRTRRWRGCVRRGGGAYHVRIDELRSAPDLGSFREKRWLTLHGDPTRSTFPRRLPHRNRAPGYSSYGWFHLSPY